VPRYDVAFLDASLLIPMPICDTLLRSAEAGLFTPRWSADILAEIERNLGPWIGKEPARRRLAAMRVAFPRAMVTGYGHLIETMTNHPKDRHVLAAAVVADAGLIVTANVRDFPRDALEAHRIFAWPPDTFLAYLLKIHANRLIGVIRSQAAELRNPPVTLVELLNDLAIDAPEFVRQIEPEFT
jgi:hypothetical protein